MTRANLITASRLAAGGVMLAVVAGLLISAPSAALAAQTHAYSFSFGGPGSGAGQLALVSNSGVAVNGQTGDVYVADTGNNRVDEFTAKGEFVLMFGKEVNKTKVLGGVATEAEQNVCTEVEVGLGAECQKGTSGTSPGELEAPVFVAVDNSAGPSHGDVYVAASGEISESPKNLVSKFDGEGKLVESWGVKGQLDGSSTIAEGSGDLTAGSTTVTNLTTTTAKAFAVGQQINGAGIINGGGEATLITAVGSGTLTLSHAATASGSAVALSAGSTFGQPNGIAIDTAGTLWVYVGGTVKFIGPHMYEFAEAGAFKEINELAPSYNENALPGGFALDSSGHVYLSQQGAAVAKLPPNKRVFVGTNTGLAVAPSSDDLYVDTGSSIADISSQCEPSINGCAPVQVFGAPQLSGAAGLAVDAAGVVYAANTIVDQVAVLPVVFEVNPSPGSASPVTATTATLNGQVNPDGAQIGECYFEYATAGEYGEGNLYSHTVPCEQTSGTIGEGTAPVAVHAKIAGLLGGTVYHYRLVAKKAATVLSGNDETFATSPVPVVANAEAREVTATGAELRASVNPKGVQVTRCAFEYGTSTEYGQLAKCEPAAAQIGAGTEPVQVTAKIAGLSPDTTYHWRLQARDGNGEAIGLDNTFVYDTTGAQLPDGRAYEMVTPPSKNGASLGNCIFCAPVHFSRDGSRVIVPSIQCFAETPSCTGDRQNEGEPYEFTRGPAGWVTTPLAPPAAQATASTAWMVGADEGVALFSMSTGPSGEDEWYVRTREGTFTSPGPAAPPGTTGIVPIQDGAQLSTRDLSHLLWEAQSPHWPFDQTTAGVYSLYEYVGSRNKEPFLVGVKGPRGSSELISTCETAPGAPGGDIMDNPLSADGRTVYFTAAGPCASGPPVNELYARVDGELKDAHTVAISRPECGGDVECKADEAHPSAAFFDGASEDGSRAFFLDTQELTAQATQGAGTARECSSGSGCNLYLYDFALPEGKRLIDVSAAGTSGLEGGGPQVQGVVATSADGSHVYFVAKGVLSAQPNSQGRSGRPGLNNLYVYQRDASYPEGHIVFITALPGADRENWIGAHYANVTPDGRFLVFESHGDLTSDDVRTDGAMQVFRYDAQSEGLVRVSVGDRGFSDNGNAGTGDATIVPAASGEQGPGPARDDPTMSDDGSFVFFQSPVALTPHALDGVILGHSGSSGKVIYAQNVYEWHEGRVYLISDGRDVATGHFKCGSSLSAVCLVGSDVTGHNVFFTTADQLVPSDTDTQIDIYDARVCEPEHGNPCVSPPPPPLSPCGGEACHGIPSGTPSLLAPASAFFNGEGNVAPESKPVVKAKSLSRAQKLAGALKVCRKKPKKKRAGCEKSARRRYGAAKAKKSAKTNRRAK